jgi:hypothetical protein
MDSTLHRPLPRTPAQYLAAGEGVNRDADGAAMYSTPNEQGDQQLYDGENDGRSGGSVDSKSWLPAWQCTAHLTKRSTNCTLVMAAVATAIDGWMQTVLPCTAHRMKKSNNCTVVKVVKVLGVAAAVTVQGTPTTMTPFPLQLLLLSHSQMCSSSKILACCTPVK